MDRHQTWYLGVINSAEDDGTLGFVAKHFNFSKKIKIVMVIYGLSPNKNKLADQLILKTKNFQKKQQSPGQVMAGSGPR